MDNMFINRKLSKSSYSMKMKDKLQ